ncbi:MAG TPA: outer membrane protein assembly factor BamA [Phycisphaerae bacterium]|nr:outer membrane protein assembly factor BamA [Phycisphaerae bacterium]
MRSLLALSVGAAIGLSFAAQAQAQNETVIEVRVEGNRQMSTEAVLSYVKVRVGQKYDEAAVKADQRRLLDTKRFDNVIVTRTPTDKGVIVTFKVVERPTVEKVTFVGNRAFKADELAKSLTFGLGDALSVAAVRAGRDAIATKYRGEGYYDVEVEFDSGLLERQREVVYRIREGARAFVTGIVFEGNKYFTDVWLRQKIGTAKRRWPIFAGKLEMEQLAQDVQVIRNLYVSDGFLAVEVDRLLAFSPDKKQATVKFAIKEGLQFRMGRIAFKGNTAFSGEQLARRLALSQGVVFTPLKLQQDIQKIESTYGQLGYIEVQVASRRTFQAAPGVVDVEFTILESGQFSIRKIDVRGNTITQERVVRRELTFFPGQRFDTEAIKESERRLTESMVFGKAMIRPVAAPGAAANVRDVVVQVEEAETARVFFGAGVSSDHGLVGKVGFTDRNFDITRGPRTFGETFSGRAWRGAGQTLQVTAEPGTELMRFHVDWREPYLFDKPYALGTQAFLFDRERETYDERRYGGAVSLGHRFKNRWYGELATRIEGVKLYGLDRAAPPEVVKDAGSHALVGLKGSLIRDRTDSRWMPSAGDRFHVAYEQVVGDYTFGRMDAGYNYYRTLYTDAIGRKHVLKTRVAGGHIFGDAPVFERYYGGGSSWIRGFEYRGISPRSKGTSEPIGGDFTVFAGCEYEFPIIGRGLDQVRGVVFLDSGTVEKDFTITAYRASVGVGARWYVRYLGPVPITLDFGIPISKDGKDDTELFSFTVSWAF